MAVQVRLSNTDYTPGLRKIVHPAHGCGLITRFLCMFASVFISALVRTLSVTLLYLPAATARESGPLTFSSTCSSSCRVVGGLLRPLLRASIALMVSSNSGGHLGVNSHHIVGNSNRQHAY